MKLKSIKYYNVHRFGSLNNWQLEGLNLGLSNLIVGRNATGKSRVAQLIVSFAKMIALKTPYLYTGIWALSFETKNGQTLKYDLSILGENEIKEKILLGEKEVLDRRDQTRLFSFQQNKFIFLNPPENKLVLHIRRDVEEFPFFEELANWAEQTYGFKFGNISPYSSSIDKNTDRLTSVDNIPKLLEELSELNEGKNDPDFIRSKIIDDFNSLGYDLKDVKVDTSQEGNTLKIKEGSLKEYLPQNMLSQGMFRALALLVFIEYIISVKKASTIIIDDLCEGLDYDRAAKLGKFIFTTCEKNNIQLIATTNDSFLMDAVDIKNWNVLFREENVVKAINYDNNPRLFEEFKYTGLSNFDLFSSDYILDK